MSLGVLFKGRPLDANPAAPPSLLFSGSRIPRETFRVMTQADDVLREAEAACALLMAQATALIESQTQRAHAQGLAAGRAEAVAAVLGTLEVERRLRELLAHRLAGIVEYCVRSLIGEHGDAELMRQRVLHLLHTANDEAPAAATLYVCHADLPSAQALAAESGRCAELPLAGLIVVADERRPPGSLLLEARLGFIESDLALTIEEARELLQQSLAHALNALEPAT